MTNEVLLLLQSTLMMDDTRTKEDELLFQSALVLVSMDIEGQWEKIAERVPGKTVEDVSAYFEALVCEVIEIESGRVELSSYADDVDEEDDDGENNVVVKKKRGRKAKASWGGEPGTSTLMMDDTRTKEDELLFQSALVLVSMDIEGQWEKIAERVPGKTVEDVSAYFEALVCEVIEI
nr:transcription factor DIVARICATA-like [Tanacetum cinerariifolium]